MTIILVGLGIALFTLITVSKDLLFYLQQSQQGVLGRKHITSKKSLFRIILIAIGVGSFLSRGLQIEGPYSRQWYFISQLIILNIIVIILFIDRLPLLITRKQKTLKQPLRTSRYRLMTISIIAGILGSSLALALWLLSHDLPIVIIISITIGFLLARQICLPLITWIFSAVSRLISKDNNPDNISDVKILSIMGESGKYVFVLEHAGKEYDFRTDAKDEEIIKKLAAEIISHLDNGIAYEILYEHSKRVME